jgi:sugar/nucleoside kinase (ribokinase family)
LTGAVSIEAAAEVLCQKCDHVVIKLGAQGGLARHGKQSIRASALTIQVVDTVGAGDSFDGGFLYGYLHDWSLERSLSLAAVCGSLSTSRAGGTTAQPTLEEAMKYVATAG